LSPAKGGIEPVNEFYQSYTGQVNIQLQVNACLGLAQQKPWQDNYFYSVNEKYGSQIPSPQGPAFCFTKVCEIAVHL
jgi:hypothetical protein